MTPRTTPARRRRSLVTLATATTVLGLGLSACSSGGTSGTSGASQGGAATAADQVSQADIDKAMTTPTTLTF